MDEFNDFQEVMRMMDTDSNHYCPGKGTLKKPLLGDDHLSL